MRRILLIDDDPQTVDALRSPLSAAGYALEIEPDGRKGLDRARSTPPDLILLDALPLGLDGFEVLRELRTDAATTTIPIVLLSGVHSGAISFPGHRGTDPVAPDAFFEKPPPLDALLGALHQLTERYPDNPAPHRSPTVLIAEDDPPSRRMLEMALRGEGYDVIDVSNGRDALTVLERTPVDVLLSDIRMPEMNGLDLLGWTRQNLPGLTVVMMTAYGSEEIAVEAMKRGANDYLTKPIHTRELSLVLRENLHRHRLEVEHRRFLEHLKRSARTLSRQVAELEERNRLLHAAQQSFAKSQYGRAQLVSSITHEIRSPLTVIRGVQEMLLRRRDKIGEKEFEKLLGRAQDQTRRMSELIDELLDVERLETGVEALKATDVDLSRVLCEVCANFGPVAESAEMELDLSVEPGDAVVRADLEAVVRILNNLLSNAFKYAPRRTVVEVALQRRVDYWEIIVTDRGPGVPEEMRELIFDRYVRRGKSRSALSSSGLGLSIARSLAELLGGEVGMEPHPGGGSIFFLRLPQAGVDSVRPHRIGAVGLDPEFAVLLALELGGRGVELRPIEDSAELGQSRARFDTVVVDLASMTSDRLARFADPARTASAKGSSPNVVLLPGKEAREDLEPWRDAFPQGRLLAQRPTAVELAEEILAETGAAPAEGEPMDSSMEVDTIGA